MDLETTALLLVVSALAMNQLVMRVETLYRSDLVFWSLEGLQVAFGGYLLARGLPGMREMPAVGFMLGLLFLFHTVQNFRTRQVLLRQETAEEAYAARRERAARIRDALVDEEESS